MLEALSKHFHEEDLFIKQLIAVAAGHFAGNLPGTYTFTEEAYYSCSLCEIHSLDSTIRLTSFAIFKKFTPNSTAKTYFHSKYSFIDNVGMQDACVTMSHLGMIKWLLRMVRCHHYIVVEFLM